MTQEEFIIEYKKDPFIIKKKTTKYHNKRAEIFERLNTLISIMDEFFVTIRGQEVIDKDLDIGIKRLNYISTMRIGGEFDKMTLPTQVTIRLPYYERGLESLFILLNNYDTVTEETIRNTIEAIDTSLSNYATLVARTGKVFEFDNKLYSANLDVNLTPYKDKNRSTPDKELVPIQEHLLYTIYHHLGKGISGYLDTIVTLDKFIKEAKQSVDVVYRTLRISDGD